MRMRSADRLKSPPETAPLLVTGDRMTQREFHRRYETYPEDIKFELIGGIVYMTSPLRWRHGRYHVKLATVFGRYEEATPGVEAGDNATTILGEESEPQPDLAVRILPECGGRSRLNAKEYVVGPPELVAEIAYSTRAIDLHLKRNDSQQAGVIAYLVVCLEEQELHWFHFPTGSPLRPNRQGIYQSRVLPGLWVNGSALFDDGMRRLSATLRQGLASREHAAFVKRLQAARRKRS